MKITIDISDPLDARYAWLAAVEAAPVWHSADGKQSACTPPLWARLLRAALDGGWPREEAEYTLCDFEQALGAASSLAQAVGAPSSPKLEWGDVWEHRTRNDYGSTVVRLFFVTSERTTLEVEGPREEAVTRRMHAACAALERMRRGRKPDDPIDPFPATDVDPEIVKRYTAPDEEQDLVSADPPVVHLDREQW